MKQRILRLPTRWLVALGPLVVAAIATVGAGCTTVERKHLKLDSPAVIALVARSAAASSAQAAGPSGGPSAAMTPDPPVCARDEKGSLYELKLGKSCYALVRAADWHSTTNLRVEPNWSIDVDVPPGQLWYDADRINTAPQGDEGSFLMRLFGGLKRHDEPYFALMATVVKCNPETPAQSGSPAALALKPGFRKCRDAPGGKATRISQETQRLVVPVAGELAFYVNDAVFPWRWHNMFYWNNEGQIWVRVTLVAKG